MKKLLILLGISSLFLTGCLKRDTMEDVDIYTTVYPIEYITQRLYGDHSNVLSIYPDGVDVKTYKLTDKNVKDYSKSSLYIFNGLSNEKNYVFKMFKHNKHLKIINATESMEFQNEMEELWLDPSNFLMLTQNIKNGFHEYLSNHYLKNEITERYEQLKIEISNIDAKMRLLSENTSDKTLVVSNDLFKYLEKYNFNVISLEENENLTEKTVVDVKNMIKNKAVHYIYVKKNEELNETVKKIVEETGVELIELNTISNLTEEERNDKKDYISLMNENIELLKNELYE